MQKFQSELWMMLMMQSYFITNMGCYREGFQDMVKNVWKRPVAGNTPILRWNNKMRAMCKYLSGWAGHVSGILEKEKSRLSSIIDDLEALAELRPLSPQEIELKSQSNAQIAGLLHEEELKWYQRSKAQFILEGDSNTRYFHGIANQDIGKKHIHSLVQDEGLIEGHEQLKPYITNYYKGLFGPPGESSFSLDETRTDDIPQMSMEENGLLTAPYSEEEVQKAIFQMEHNKAPGPDGFPNF
jgi:mannosylglycoprotein endo-beta-mannosidase